MSGKKKLVINNEIKARNVRLISEDKQQLGIMSLDHAKSIARQKGLDLVQVNADSNPIVCKLMDYGKFQFNLKKQHTESKRKSKRTQLKEIKFRPRTDKGDYNVKVKSLRKFLEEGDKTKITLRFRGREVNNKESALEIFERVRLDLEDISSVEKIPEFEGRQMMMILAPLAKGLRVKPKVQEVQEVQESE